MRAILPFLLAAGLLADIYMRDGDSVYAWLWEGLVEFMSYVHRLI